MKGPILTHLTSRHAFGKRVYIFKLFQNRCYIASDVISGGGVTKRKTLILDFCSPDTWITQVYNYTPGAKKAHPLVYS